jgi:hypothetical protein
MIARPTRVHWLTRGGRDQIDFRKDTMHTVVSSPASLGHTFRPGCGTRNTRALQPMPLYSWPHQSQVGSRRRL